MPATNLKLKHEIHIEYFGSFNYQTLNEYAISDPETITSIYLVDKDSLEIVLSSGKYPIGITVVSETELLSEMIGGRPGTVYFSFSANHFSSPDFSIRLSAGSTTYYPLFDMIQEEPLDAFSRILLTVDLTDEGTTNPGDWYSGLIHFYILYHKNEK